MKTFFHRRSLNALPTARARQLYTRTQIKLNVCAYTVQLSLIHIQMCIRDSPTPLYVYTYKYKSIHSVRYWSQTLTRTSIDFINVCVYKFMLLVCFIHICNVAPFILWYDIPHEICPTQVECVDKDILCTQFTSEVLYSHSDSLLDKKILLLISFILIKCKQFIMWNLMFTNMWFFKQIYISKNEVFKQ